MLSVIAEEDSRHNQPSTTTLLLEDVLEARHSNIATVTQEQNKSRRNTTKRAGRRLGGIVPRCVNCLRGGGGRHMRAGKDEVDMVDDSAATPLNSSHTFIEDPLHGTKRFDVNLYASKKSAASGLMDLALLMANASQLKHVLVSDGNHRFYPVMLGLIIASIVLQIIIGIALLILSRWRIAEHIDTEEIETSTRRANQINNVVVGSILILTVLNVFISAFGLDEAKPAGKG